MIVRTLVALISIKATVRTVRNAVRARITTRSSEVGSILAVRTCEIGSNIVLAVFTKGENFITGIAGHVDFEVEGAAYTITILSIGCGNFFPVAATNFVNFNIINGQSLL